MENDILLLSVDDIPRYTSISANLDVDRMTPYIRLAQRTELKRILGIELYNKIVTDFSNDSLAGLYKTIYDEFVVDILVNYSAYNIVLFNSLRIDNAGNFFYEPDDSRSADMEDTEKIAARYQKIAAAIELQFYKWLGNNKIKERPDSGSCCTANTNTFKLPWLL